jgi:uncharacterized OB-fold protein
MSASPAVEGWFTTGPEPALLGSRCTTCSKVYFPPVPADGAGFCRNPGCDGEEFETAELSRRGTVWSYTDAQYQPPPPYVARTDPYQPFALAAVELAEGITVLGQVADGYGVADLKVGAEVELVIEPLDDAHSIWRWKPVAELGEEADQ